VIVLFFIIVIVLVFIIVFIIVLALGEVHFGEITRSSGATKQSVSFEALLPFLLNLGGAYCYRDVFVAACVAAVLVDSYSRWLRPGKHSTLMESRITRLFASPPASSVSESASHPQYSRHRFPCRPRDAPPRC
jgi:flagellar basal body-associated protein FliL